MKPKHPQATGPYKFLAIFFALFSTPFFLVGVGALLDVPEKGWNEETIVGIPFFLFGLGGLYGAFRAFLFWRWRDQQIQQHPDQPWMWDKSWAKGLGKSNHSTKLYVFLGVGILFAGMGTAGLAGVWNDIMKGQYALLLLAIFPLVGLSFLTAAVVTFQRQRKFGKVLCHLHSLPGWTGDRISLSVEIPYQFPQGLKYKASLKNTYTYSTGSGKNRTTHTVVKAQMDTSGDVPAHMPTARIPLNFDIPVDGYPTDTSGSTTYAWSVNLTIAKPGLDLMEEFQVPVFKDPARQSSHGLSISDLEKKSDQEIIENIQEHELAEARSSYNNSGATRIDFIKKGQFLSFITSLFGTSLAVAFCLGFAYAGTFKSVDFKNFEWSFELLFTSAFTIIPSIILIFILALQIYRVKKGLTNTSLFITSQGLGREKRFLGMKSQIFLTWEDIADFEGRCTMKVNGEERHWDLRAHLKNGERAVHLMGTFKDKPSLLWVIKQLEDQLSHRTAA